MKTDDKIKFKKDSNRFMGIWSYSLAASIYAEMSATIESKGIFLTIIIIMIAVFSYYGGLYGGIVYFMLFSGATLVTGLLSTPKELSVDNQLPIVIGFIISLSIGTLGWKIKTNEAQVKKAV